MTDQRTVVDINHIAASGPDRLILKIMIKDHGSLQTSCRVDDIFTTIKSMVAELTADDWEVASQINSLNQEDFSKKFRVQLPPSLLVAPQLKDKPIPGAVAALLQVVKSLDEKIARQEGIANLVEAIQEDALENLNPISTLIDKMYDPGFGWHPESQGSTKVTGIAWGADYELRATHVIGNWYIEGWIGIMKMRVFKTHSTVQIYLTTMDVNKFNTDRCDLNFSVHKKEEFFEWIKDLAKRQAKA